MLFQTIQPKIICWDGCGNLTYVCIYSSDKGRYFAQMGKVNLMYVSSIHILPSYPNGCVHLCTPVVAGCKFLELMYSCILTQAYPILIKTSHSNIGECFCNAAILLPWTITSGDLLLLLRSEQSSSAARPPLKPCYLLNLNFLLYPNCITLGKQVLDGFKTYIW